MKKSFLLLCLLFSVCIQVLSNTYGVMTGCIGNVFYSGTATGETQYQNQAIAFLCSEYLKRHHADFDEKVFLELGFGEKVKAELSYDKFQGRSWDHAEQNRPAKGNGVRLRLSSTFHRSEYVLKLLEYSVTHIDELKAQNTIYFKIDYYDRPNELTVDTTVLSGILKETSDDKISSTLAIKVFRNLGNVEYQVSKEYYLQNDEYHFVDYFHNDSVYLILPKIYQIISEHNLGSLIFETDSTGFFYSREKRALSNRFTILNKQESFYYIHTSSDDNKKRIYFEYQPYTNKIKKFIYLTDKLILIQKVESYEDEMIQKQIQN
jgi:hypothetical protein